MKKKITITIVSTLALIAMILTGLMLTGCQAVGVGEMVTRSKDVSDFTSLRVSGSFIVELQEGDTHSLEITMQENLFEFLEVRVNTTGQLIIETRRGFNIITTSNNTPRAIITAPNLASISTSGSTRVSADFTIERDAFGISTSGSSRVDLDLDVTTLNVTTSGSSVINLELNATTFNLESSGSSTFNLSGEATTVDFRTSGSANINAFELATQTAAIRASGSARVDLAVSTTLNVNISGSSRVRYIGNPTITQSISGSGSINPHIP